MVKTLIRCTLLPLCIGAAASAALAAPITFFGENQSPNPVRTVSGNPVAARTSFLSYLSGVSSAGFENFAVGDSGAPPLRLNFAGSAGTTLTADLSGSGFVTDNFTLSAGRFNTTAGGSKWWDTTGNFTLTFGSAVSAFGFYGTDIGDFGEVLSLLLTDTTGRQTSMIVPNTANGNNGSLLFFGFIDTAVSYTSITFRNPSGIDAFGFDDMVIGDRAQVVGTPVGFPNVGTVPEPASLALVGLALAGLGASTMRRSRHRHG